MRTLIPWDLRFDFVGPSRPLSALSALLVSLSLLAAGLYGIPLGIDFAGGVSTRVRIVGEGSAGEAEIRAALAAARIDDTAVSRIGDTDDRTFVIHTGRNDATTLSDVAGKIESALAAQVRGVSVERIDYVGPRAGREFRERAEASIAASLGLIAVYMGFRFAPRYVPGAVVALIHDAILSATAVVVCGYAIDFTVIAALLTVVGYSLNDTIVIYDRIREKVAGGTPPDLERWVNESLNETLSRTILTAGTTLLASGALLVLGGEGLRPFAIAVTAGVVVGTYSSLFVATPILLYLSRGSRRPPTPIGPSCEPEIDRLGVPQSAELPSPAK